MLTSHANVMKRMANNVELRSDGSCRSAFGHRRPIFRCHECLLSTQKSSHPPAQCDGLEAEDLVSAPTRSFNSATPRIWQKRPESLRSAFPPRRTRLELYKTTHGCAEIRARDLELTGRKLRKTANFNGLVSANFEGVVPRSRDRSTNTLAATSGRKARCLVAA